MPLHLTIENEASLPDGGPISCTVTRRRGIDIGRDQYLDWVLPDPTRGISGKHCEIRFRDGRYWLNDVSTNGTFVNRSEFRLSQPHALSHGDRIEIGPFIISVAIEPDEDGQNAATAGAATPSGGYGDNQLWSVGEAAPAINPRELRAPVVAAGIGSQDVLDWAVSLPPVDARYTPSPLPYDPPPPPQAPPAMAAPEPLDWAMPQPNRPIRRTEEEPQYVAPAVPEPIQPVLPPVSPQMAPPPFAAMQPAMPPEIPAAAPVAGQTAPEPSRGGFVWDIEKEADLPPVPMRASGNGTAPPAMTAAPVAPAALPVQAAPERPSSTPPAGLAAPPPPRMPPADMRPMQPQMAEPPLAPTGYATPAPVPPPPTYAPPAAAYAGNGDALVQRFAQAAGIPPELMRTQDAGQLMDMLGALTRITADSLRQLQTARAQSKGVMRSANHTVIEATGNNPLRFSPTTDDALKIMFGPRTSGYLPAGDALEQSFTDLKKHQMLLFTAMQTALKTLMSDLAPEKIEAAVGDDKGFGALLTSRKAKLWERYETQWKAKVGNNEQGMLGVFMLLFADAYDKSS